MHNIKLFFRDALNIPAKWTIGLALLLFFITACSVTSHPVEKVHDKQAYKFTKLRTNTIEKVKFQKFIAAEWTGKREGLINFDHAKVKASGLQKSGEPLELYFYIIDHPTYGRYLIDTGISEAVHKDTKDSPINWAIKNYMNFSSIKVHTTIKSIIDPAQPIKGIFLTHMHLDHVAGFLDLPRNTAIYIGKNETTKKQVQNIFVHRATNSFLKGHSPLKELQFTSLGEAIDFFNDGSVLIFWTPGHTAGMLSFFIRSQNGNHLIVGDNCHTIWGWKNAVGPGYYSMDKEQNQKVLEWLIDFSKKSKKPMKIHLGHQDINK